MCNRNIFMKYLIKTYYKNHFAGNFDGPDSKRIDAEVSIAFKLYSARKEKQVKNKENT